MRIYVASSWRNQRQPEVVAALRAAGHEVYDFRNPAEGNYGFHWSDIDPRWREWSPDQYRTALKHPVAEAGFALDFSAMEWADAFVLVQPCGRSAHLELGWAVGADKLTCILLSDGEPELMANMVDRIAIDLNEVLAWLDGEGSRIKAYMKDHPDGPDPALVTLRDVQRYALSVAPDPGPGLRWRADDACLDVDLLGTVDGEYVAWIEPTSWGWKPVLMSAPGLDTEVVKLTEVNRDPRVAMQAILDALKER